MVRLGGEYIFDKTMIAAADLDMTTGGVQRESGMGMHLGAEKWVNADAAGNFGFRAGFALDSEYSPAYSLTFGVSYAREDFDVDYAFIPDFRSLGETHKINLTYFFGEQVKTGEKKKTAVEQLKTVTAVAETPTAQVVRPELLSGAVMEVSSRYVSPGKNTIKFMITDASYDPGDLDINLDIIDAKNKTVCTLSAFGKIPGYIEWNGSIDGKIWANDGDYTAKMSIKENNSLLWEKTRVVTVDQTPPVSEITVEPKIFAANPASTVKEMAIIVKSRYSDIKSWQLAVKDEQSNVVKRLTGEGFAAKIMWNGKDALGNYVKDGKYVVAVTFEDFAGNTYDAANSVKISSELVKFSVTTDNMIFKPGKDAVKFLVKIPAGANVSGWEAEITEKDGNSVRTFRNRPTGSAGVTWDTANENNEAVRLGTVYKYKISVNQKSGLVSVQEGLLQSVLPEFTSTGIKLTLAAVKFDPEDKKISADQLKVLKQASDAIKQYAKDYYVFVKAYSTDYKDHEANFRLSIERAQEVAEYLTKSQGIPGEHIYIIGYGDGEYADSSIKDSIVSKGNRAEVELLAK
jgi:outer membrane protein OmpA-like peptidoglycan-associated protein